jgi:hypothetical protein
MHCLGTLYTTCCCGSWCGHELLAFTYTWSLDGWQKQGVHDFLVKFMCGLNVKKSIKSNENILNDVQNLTTIMVSFKFSLEEFNLQ